VFTYQVNRLLGRNNVVHVFRSDSLTSCRIQNCVMNDGVNSSREQNPFISRQILERDEFLLSSRVGLWESRIEMSLSECRGCDLRIARRRRHQR
jgi:hypothetical protein